MADKPLDSAMLEAYLENDHIFRVVRMSVVDPTYELELWYRQSNEPNTMLQRLVRLASLGIVTRRDLVSITNLLSTLCIME